MLLALKVGIPIGEVISLIMSGILESSNFLTIFETGLKSIFEISTSGYFVLSSTNSVLGIASICTSLSDRYLVNDLSVLYGSALAFNSARLVASLSITSQSEWHTASSKTFPDARPLV